MITSRFLTVEDHQQLSNSLSEDEYHKDTPLEFFLEEGTVCSVFEDETGVVLFVRGQPLFHKEDQGIRLIRLDIQYLNNVNAKRNLRTMLEGFPILEKRAKDNGFIGFIFSSAAPLLRKFCIKRLGFEPVDDEFLVKVLYDDPVEIVDKPAEDVIQ